MRKIVYLCAMMLLGMDMMAQIDLDDKNWDIVFIDNFSGNRAWDRHWDDSTNVSGYKPLWRCFSYNFWDSGVTRYSAWYPNYAAYQKSNAVFGTDNTLKLIGEFKTVKEMSCERDYLSDTTYLPAPWRKYCHSCDDLDDQCPDIHYYSGMIESTDSLGYGYYEMKCRMPVHRGSHDAFWFWGDYGKYEEIDVFEHGANICDGDTTRGFNAGIYYNPDGPNYVDDTNSVTGIITHGAYNYAQLKYHIPLGSPTLDHYHTYGCLWMPERIAWYFDGLLINEETDPSHIPQHPMWLKITHHEDQAAKTVTQEKPIWWQGTDEMTVDYVKHYRLKTDCNTDLVIQSLSAFQQFNHTDNYKVKRSVTLGSPNASLVIPGNINFTLRAVESITINGEFEVPQGTGMTLIIQDCPECSQEGVHSQNYCPN